jgi:hypothetical protein
MRALTLLTFACLCAVGATVYAKLRAPAVHVPVPSSGDATVPDARRSALQQARRSYRMPDLDAFVAEQRAEVEKPGSGPAARRCLAEALVERVQQRSALRGIAIGQPVLFVLTEATVRDLDEAMQMLLQARLQGDESSENYRLEAAVLSNRITSAVAAMGLNGRIQAALQKAGDLDAKNPGLHFALGVRDLLTPRWLGQDLPQAAAHLEYAAAALADDERPPLFAAMAACLQQKRLAAIAWLEQAVARNPDNVFARVVLARVRKGEDEPFSRDVTAAEAAQTR